MGAEGYVSDSNMWCIDACCTLLPQKPSGWLDGSRCFFFSLSVLSPLTEFFSFPLTIFLLKFRFQLVREGWEGQHDG